MNVTATSPARAPHASPRRSGERARACLSLVLLAVLVSACGYHPRGSVELPGELRGIYVEGGSRVLEQRLEVLFSDAGVDITEDRGAADAVLELHGESFNERVLSVDAETGKSQEFEVTYSVAFDMRRPDGTLLVPRQSVNLLRDYFFDAEAVIGKSRERSVLRTEMRRDAAQQIVRRMQAALDEEG